MDKKYTTADIARTLAVSERTVRRKLAKHLTLSNGKYEVSEEFFNFLKGNTDFADTPSDSLRTSADTLGQDEDTYTKTQNHIDSILGLNVEFDIVEGFTAEEYQKFQKRLTEYPLLKEHKADSKEHIAYLKNQIEYHKNSVLEHQKQTAIILKTIQERTLIEAKEKKIID